MNFEPFEALIKYSLMIRNLIHVHGGGGGGGEGGAPVIEWDKNQLNHPSEKFF